MSFDAFIVLYLYCFNLHRGSGTDLHCKSRTPCINLNNNCDVLSKTPKFNPEEISLDKYLVVMEANFAAYEETDEDKKKNFLIVSLGPKTFGTLCNLCAPQLPGEGL